MSCSKLGIYSHLGMYGLKIAIGLVLLSYLQKMNCILVVMMYIHLSKPIPGLRGAENGWMAVDTFG
jgi:hypothetical protein